MKEATHDMPDEVQATLEVLDHLQTVRPESELKSRILARIDAESASPLPLRRAFPRARLAIAAALLLLAVNGLTLARYAISQDQAPASEASAIAQTYQLSPQYPY